MASRCYFVPLLLTELIFFFCFSCSHTAQYISDHVFFGSTTLKYWVCCLYTTLELIIQSAEGYCSSGNPSVPKPEVPGFCLNMLLQYFHIMSFLYDAIYFVKCSNNKTLTPWNCHLHTLQLYQCSQASKLPLFCSFFSFITAGQDFVLGQLWICWSFSLYLVAF